MDAIIKRELKNIERDYNIRILYACESGSRVWGFPSKDSDYDVRFIYIHHPDWYVSIDEKKDVIELPINELLDINGWDIRKTLKLFRKSNPPLQEWLRSEIVYYQKYSFHKKIKEMSADVFSPGSCLYHYLSMAKGNYRDYLQSERVKIKKYFYVLRPILACKWIEKYHSMPPLAFNDLLDDLVPKGELKVEINRLLWRKINGEELDMEQKIDSINSFIEHELEYFEKYDKPIKRNSADLTERLDQLFRNTLSEVWTM